MWKCAMTGEMCKEPKCSEVGCVKGLESITTWRVRGAKKKSVAQGKRDARKARNRSRAKRARAG